MEKYTIKIKDLAKLYLYTDIESINKKMRNNPRGLTKTIPAEITYLGEVNTITEDHDYILILEHDKKTINVDVKNNTATLLSPQNKFFFPDFVYLAIGMLANNLQRIGHYFIQSSVVKYDDKHSIMLIGDPNSGKTSMAYGLMKNNGYKLISNDNVLVGLNEDNQLKTVCGTKTMQMRYGGIKLFYPELLPYITIDPEDKNRDDWDIKIYIDDYLKNNGFQYADDSIVTDIYNISTYKSGDTFIRNKERIDEILLIYQQLTGQIRNFRYALTGYHYPLPSFEDDKYRQARYDMAEKICENTNIYDARGTVEELSKKLVKK